MVSKKYKHLLLKVNPVTAALLLALPVVAQANIDMHSDSVNQVNGITVIDINKANSNGISHNIYDKFNVGNEGLIFNNSQNGANTVLAGQIGGNTNLSTGAASVILNEVQSRNRSDLNGLMEVAGSKAQLIIANPSGISCNSCGFINTESVTLTTGKPDMKNGMLEGYSVNGGDIKVNGKLTSDSPTAILARSAVINGTVAANKELTVVLGNNYVATNNQVLGEVKATGSRGWYSLDVAKIGGMYSDKITLVSTEKGVGVRNNGVLAAGNGGIQIDTRGELINSSATIKSAGDISIQTAGALNNVTGNIAADKSVYIDTSKNTVDNSRSGNLIAGQYIGVNSGSFINTNGKVATAGTLAINTNGAELVNSGKGKTVGMEATVVVMETGHLDNRDGQIKGYYVGTKSSKVNNNNGIIDAYQNIDMTSNDYVDNTRGLIRSATGRVKIDASKGNLWNNNTKSADTVSEDSRGIIAGIGGVEIAAGNLYNAGQIASTGNIGINSTGLVNNRNGKISTYKDISVLAKSVDNSMGGIGAIGNVNVEATNGNIENYIGVMSSDEQLNLKGMRINNHGGLMMGKDINLISAGDIDNNAALMVAKNKVTLAAQGTLYNNYSNDFGRNFGVYFGIKDQPGGIIGSSLVDISAKNVYNDYSRIVAKAGALKLNASNYISNYASLLVGNTAADIKAKSFNNNYSTLHSGGDLNIDVESLSNWSSGSLRDNNATGVISAENNLKLNMKNNLDNFGYITAKNNAAISTQGLVTNFNTINAGNELKLNANYGILNWSDIHANNKMDVSSEGTITNYGNIFTEGSAIVTANHLFNTLWGTVGGLKGLDLDVKKVTNHNIIVGL
ncbi:filamentous hemagglutinin N-terminal domain-containing protein [Rahnella bruchi]|uniref:filamentous hemagglutinin N-terminal domain-containing protein n=1 Tax=Rahnella bruchi TaxID=1510573 RepID=UPI000EA2EB53|nr:filamentous hemagglutinin N-terminal domain-containing protein [Rahnella bruchi]